MYIIIAGGGVLGNGLVRRLLGSRHEVVVIEKYKELCDELFAAYGVETISGSATQLSVLKAAGIEKADIVIATMRNDADNLAFAVLAKSFNVPQIIVRMYKKEYVEAYKTAGVTRVISMIDTMIADIMHEVERPDIQQVAQLGDGAVEIFMVHMPADGKLVGKTISEIATNKKMSEESIIAGIYDEKTKEFKVPRGNTKVSAESVLFVITKPELVKKTGKFLIQT